MCGICGKVDFSGKVVDRDLIDRMCRTLIHRGPDAQGIHVEPGVGLGQRRLSIIDLSDRATAPLANEDETIWVVFNGEIYNFQELRKELMDRGHSFRTRTDTEVILHLYEEHGEDCLARMRGMFAFALWDSRCKRLFAARDRLGKKPFVYALPAGGFVFASEIKAVTADPSVPVAPNYRALDRYLTYQYVPSPLTAFEGIHRLPPAHWLTCDAEGRLKVRRYWRPPDPPKTDAPPEEIQERIVAELAEAVRLRMISDVPLGAFLSGGIDSGAVVALMARQSSVPVKTYSIGFEEESHDELPYARQVAERYGTEHHEFIVKPSAAEVLPLLVRHYNEPFADSSALPTYYVSKVTRSHVTVALTGDGGDENFSGYTHYGDLADWARCDAVPSLIRRPAAGALASLVDLLPHTSFLGRASRAFRMAAGRLPQRYVLWTSFLKPQEKRAAYTAKFRGLIRESPAAEDLPAALPWEEGMDLLDWMMRHDLSFILPDCFMVKTDIASMANSLEVRSPFLDHRFVEYAATIPSRLKRTRREGGKLILKSAVRDLLPPGHLTKRKTGFGIPLANWFRGELADLLRANLLDDRALRRGLFRRDFVRGMVQQHVDGRRDWSGRLWALLFLELWFRAFID